MAGLPVSGTRSTEKEATIKILWHSVAPWVPTGYGQQTATFAPRLKALGHDVAISCYYGMAGAEWTWKGIRCLPSYAEHYGNDVLVPHALHHFGGGEGDRFSEVANRGLVITLGDVWCFKAPLLPDMAVAAWTPVDHETLPGVTAKWFEQTGAVPIAMSRFGQRLLTQAGLGVLYVPHGIDTAVFCPGDQAEARQRLGLPADAFCIAMVAANIGRDAARKAFSEQILAFGELRRRHTDVMLVLHTDVTSSIGVNLQALLAELPEGSYVYSDQYAYRKGMPAERVADIYRACDVLTNCSWGEGFGIPIVEAQACGRPVVVTDTTAMPELVGAGWKVGGEPLWHDSQQAWARHPLVGGIVDAYAEAYKTARDPEMRAAAWAFAQDYDADLVTDTYWRPALAQLEEMVERRRAGAPLGAAARAPRLREDDGFVWLDRGAGSDDWVASSDHEAWLRPVFDELLPAGGVLLDVGAHIGHWTLRASRTAAHVIAVEANPATASTLRRHVAMNDVRNVTVVELAAWDETARLRLDDPNRRTNGGGTRTLADGGSVRTLPLDGHPDEAETVVAARLDDYLTGRTDIPHDRLDLVKLDVEGADIHVLRGMAGLLARYRPALLVECHDIYGYYRRADLEATLTELGYTFEVVASVPSRWMPDGESDVVRHADYLVATPVQAGPHTRPRPADGRATATTPTG